MFRIPLIVAATASIAHGAGVWTKASVRATAVIPAPPVSVSPFEIHSNVNPQELPLLHVDHI